ncbi:hypothetical protein [Acetobacter conturbans]|uniref:DUF4202 domain-containing protein n=1 Tax=Acetobacter conturbans TaxID=1737472 RepID=A0ABX0K788_9PROT|nr:hypothetical protein [Acetobacter conturbans]NHN90080.1 hypothetical protein [Acetobacter conturbans]
MTDPLFGRYRDAELSVLEQDAVRWLDGFYQLEHLFAAREWAIMLTDGTASEALKFAALLHDAERFFPGGPSDTPRSSFDDADYLFRHSTRSADIVGDWLAKRPEGVDLAFARRVRALILRHEIGGDPEEDIMQAADSLAFLSTFDWLVVDWVRKGHYDIAGARAKLDWMLARIRVPAALRLALPIYARTVAALEDPRGMTVDLALRRRQAGSLSYLTGLAAAVV